jgi:hypothetical protein
MNDKRIESLLDSVQDVALEVHSEREPASSWMGGIGRAAVIVALVGGLLGGVATFVELWRQWMAKPDVAVVVGNSLTISWNRRQRHLSFVRWITLRNDGEIVGVVDNPPHVRLESASLANAADLPEIQVEEKGGVVGFPLSVRARDSRDVQLTMSLIVPESETSFLKDGVYHLYLSIDTPSTPDPKVSCIRFTKQLIDEINESGSIRYSTPDSCGS